MNPFDLIVWADVISAEDLVAAERWWGSLSINEMKAYRDKHCPFRDWASLGVRWIHQIWVDETAPVPGR